MATYVKQGGMVCMMMTTAEAEQLHELAERGQQVIGNIRRPRATKDASDRVMECLTIATQPGSRRGGFVD